MPDQQVEIRSLSFATAVAQPRVPGTTPLIALRVTGDLSQQTFLLSAEAATALAEQLTGCARLIAPPKPEPVGRYL